MLKKHLYRKTFAFFILLAAVLRLYGINHGLPAVYHVDEPAVIRSALGLRFNLNPEHFDWPHLYFYLNYFVYMGFAVIRKFFEFYNLQNTEILKWMWVEPSVFYTLTRIFSAVLGALTVIPMYLIGKELFNKKVGLLAGGFLAVLPFHVRHSHYALIDVPMLFFLSISLYFAAKTKKLPEGKFYFLSGFLMGLAISTKYNAFLGGLFFLSMQMCRKDLLKRLKGVFTYILATLLGFALGTPFAVLDYQRFLQKDSPIGALWQFSNVGRVGVAETVTQFLNAVFIKLPDDFGYTIWALFLVTAVGIVFSLVKKRKILSIENVLALSAVLLIFYISGQRKYRSHYFMPVYPYILLTAAYGLYTISNYLKPKLRLLLFVVIFCPPIIFSLGHAKSLIELIDDKDHSGIVSGSSNTESGLTDDY